MIELLKISSMAIFEEVIIEFGPGLNCITGETGAGKSLVIGALTLLMGARANPGIISPGKDRCTVEALFYGDSNDHSEVVLRREINSAGRNRCFIDGELVTVNQLGAKTAELLHIYGQHEYQDLLNPRQHMRILEYAAGLSRHNIEDAFRFFQQADTEYEQIKREIDNNSNELETLRYTMEELAQAGIEIGLENRLEQELEIARRAAELKNGTMAALQKVYTGNDSITDQAAETDKILREIVVADPAISAALSLIETIEASAEELYLFLKKQHENYEFDQSWIDEHEDRLHALRALKRKYGKDEAGLIDLLATARKKLELTGDSQAVLDNCRLNLTTACNNYKSVIQDFIALRTEAARNLSAKINKDLQALGMQGTIFGVHQADMATIADAIVPENLTDASPARILTGEFMIATNIGHKMQPLSQIASGGELSRIMLAIKVQQNESSATMVFDEIDAGISGQTANMVANRLKSLSRESQIILVTHLHQVAAVADNHFFVCKTIQDRQTLSQVKAIHTEERILELARMMGGDNPSAAVIDHAKELLSFA